MAALKCVRVVLCRRFSCPPLSGICKLRNSHSVLIVGGHPLPSVIEAPASMVCQTPHLAFLFVRRVQPHAIAEQPQRPSNNV